MPTYDHGVSAATIGVTILNTSGAIHTARATAGITEPVAGSGVYHVAHPAAGTLLIFVFDSGVGTVGASVYSDGVTAPANRVAPDNAGIAANTTAIGNVPANVRVNLATELARLDAAVSTRNAVAPATPTNVTNAQTAVTDAIATHKAVSDGIAAKLPVAGPVASKADVDAAGAQLYAAGSGSVTVGTPITREALVERGVGKLLTFDADTTGRTATLSLYPQGSRAAALTVAGTASGAMTAVALTDAQTLALNGTYRMVLDSTLGADTVRHIDGLLTAV